MKQRSNTTEETCRNCGEAYFRRIKKVKGRRHKSSKTRPCNVVTCSRTCSRLYSRKDFKKRKESIK